MGWTVGHTFSKVGTLPMTMSALEKPEEFFSE